MVAITFSQRYQKILPALLQETGTSNMLAAPRIRKIVVNASVGRLLVQQGEKALEPLVKDLLRITGQKPALRPAKKSVSAFKIRRGMPVGLVVTLRGKRAHDFFSRLMLLALPRLRDFRGIDPKTIDAKGNLTVGIREQTAFLEAAADPTGVLFGFEATVVTTARSKEEAEKFFRLLGVPLKS